MNIYIHQRDEDIFSEIENICLKYIMKSSTDSRIIRISPENMDDISDETGIFILESGNCLAELSKRIYKRNHYNYIIITAESINSIRMELFPVVRPSGFILKPFSYETAENLISEIFRSFSEMNSSENSEVFSFSIKSQKFTLPYNSIFYFESSNKKIKIKTSSQEFETYMTLDKIAEIMPENFIRVHKSFIADMSKIKFIHYGNMIIEMNDGSVIPLSRSCKNNVKEKMSER